MTRFSNFTRLTAASLSVALAAGPAVAQSHITGTAKRGTWRIVWNLLETESTGSEFRRAVGEEMRFPFRSVRIGDAQGERLVFLDDDGDVERTISFGPGEDGMAAPDGSAYLLWTEDPTATAIRTFRFFRRHEETPDWQVTARGEPILFAEDGSLFLVAERGKGVETFGRSEPHAGGTLQVVGAGGEVRGELPIYPWFAVLTGDQRRIALLHDDELIVLGRDGRLDWDRPVRVDEITPREGITQLQAAGDVIIVAGTGSVPPGGAGSDFHIKRRGCVVAYSDSGERLWKHEQPVDEQYWFQMSVAMSPDGGTVATCHSSRREVVVHLYDSRTGELLWTRNARRGTGFRSLSVSRGGELTVLVHGASTADVRAWDRAGTTVWEGFLPVDGKIASIENDHLLVFDRWIVELTPETGPQ